LKIPLLNELIDFIFPKICIISDKKLSEQNSNQFIEDKILTALERTNNNDLINLKLKLDGDFSFSMYRFSEESNFQKIIHHIKYQGMKKLGYFMGIKAGRFILQNHMIPDRIKPDYIVPIPLYRTKERERGYNQSEYIAKGINTILTINYLDKLLIRVKNTKSQTKLTLRERQENVKNAFAINKEHKQDIFNKNIILVDDVVTSGSTLNETIKVLKKAGAETVSSLTLGMVVEN